MTTQIFQNPTTKTLPSHQLGANAINDLMAAWRLDYHLIDPSKEYVTNRNQRVTSRLLTSKYALDIRKGLVPDLRELCEQLFGALFAPAATRTPVDFIPVLKNEVKMDKTSLHQFIQGEKNSYVMVDDPLIKILLIKWLPGESTKKHGHAGGGGVIKVLKGSLEEKRFDTRMPNKLIAHATYHSGGLTYIDDNMALHQVSNPFGSEAVSLHAYVKG